MKKSKYFFCLFMMVVYAQCFAQLKSFKNNFQFHSINSVGLMEGQAGSAFQLQTINGIQCRSWYSGVGIGLDYYRFRTIPLFVDVRKEFSKNKNTFFVCGDGGINFYWKKDKDAKQFYYQDQIKPGFYAEAAVGYKLKLIQKSFFLFSCGYCYKTLTEHGANYWADPRFPGPAYNNSMEKISYHLNRLVLKAGIEF